MRLGRRRLLTYVPITGLVPRSAISRNRVSLQNLDSKYADQVRVRRLGFGSKDPAVIRRPLQPALSRFMLIADQDFL